MQPLSLRTLIELEPSFPRAVFHTTVSSAGEELSFWIERVGDDAVKRHLGCAVMFAMPEGGVDEAFRALVDILAYNTERLQLMAAPDMISQRTRGKVVRSSTRPELEIGD